MGFHASPMLPSSINEKGLQVVTWSLASAPEKWEPASMLVTRPLQVPETFAATKVLLPWVTSHHLTMPATLQGHTAEAKSLGQGMFLHGWEALSVFPGLPHTSWFWNTPPSHPSSSSLALLGGLLLRTWQPYQRWSRQCHLPLFQPPYSHY